MRFKRKNEGIEAFYQSSYDFTRCGISGHLFFNIFDFEFDLATAVSRIDQSFRDEYRKCETSMQVFRATGTVREGMENILDEEDYPATGDR